MALGLVHGAANQVLHDNSDEEAYRWLTLTVVNASAPVGSVVYDYGEFLDPSALTRAAGRGLPLG